MSSYTKIKAHQEEYLAKQKARFEPAHYTVEGVDVIVNPGVFPPASDTRLLAAHIKIKKTDRFLDLTTGAGTFALIAAKQGASGIAVDINAMAVENAQENLQRLGLNEKVDVLESNLFAYVPKNERFDYIYANGPFTEGAIVDPLDHACYGERAFIDGLLKGVSKRLKPGGKLLIVLYSLSNLPHFHQEIKANNLKVKHLDDLVKEEGRAYHLFEISI